LMLTSTGYTGVIRRDIGIALLSLGIFSSVPFWADKGLIFLAAVVLIKIAFSFSFNLIFGLTGLVSFGHAAFFAAGAYTTGILLARLPEVPFLLSWLAAGGMGALVALIVAVVALRRASGIYFAILTLALAELIHILISKSTFLGREDGLTGINRPILDIGILSLDLAAGNNLYFVTLLLTSLIGLVAYFIWHNRTGRLLAAIRQDSERVRFLGVNVPAMRMFIFVLSGCLAGLAGGLYAPTAQLLTPEIAHWSYSALPILFCLVGGVSYFWGPMLGAVIFVGLEHLTRNITGLSDIIIGLVLLIVVLGFPGGLIGGVERLIRSKKSALPAATLNTQTGHSAPP
jgi:branched-chain amino acid transport system permease protein